MLEFTVSTVCWDSGVGRIFKHPREGNGKQASHSWLVLLGLKWPCGHMWPWIPFYSGSVRLQSFTVCGDVPKLSKTMIPNQPVLSNRDTKGHEIGSIQQWDVGLSIPWEQISPEDS